MNDYANLVKQAREIAHSKRWNPGLHALLTDLADAVEALIAERDEQRDIAIEFWRRLDTVEDERDRLAAALRKIRDGDPSPHLCAREALAATEES